MGQILQNWRIPAAAIFSILIIVGSFLLARDTRSPSTAEASTESALLQAIATKDSDGDGLPDWEEALYGTNPHTTDTFSLGMDDGEAVAKGLIVPKAIANIPLTASSPASVGLDGLPPPAAEGTLTAAFAQNFFTLYLSAKEKSGSASLSESDMANVANEALRSLSSAIIRAPDFKSAKNLTVSGSGSNALIQFAVNVEAVSLRNSANATTSELSYLTSAVQNDDSNALTHIVSIAKSYRDSAVGIAALPVPQELAADVLALVNAMMRVSEVAADFARVNDDPLAAMLALQQYLPATQSLGTAFIHIGQIYKTAGISLPTGAPGASFVNLIEDIIASQRAAQKP